MDNARQSDGTLQVDDKKIAQQLFEQQQYNRQRFKRRLLKFSSYFVIAFSIFTFYAILTHVWHKHYSKHRVSYKYNPGHRVSHDKHFQLHHLSQVASSSNLRNFASKLGEEQFSAQNFEYNRSCDIFVETVTGLKEKESGPRYFQDKVDFDICRYKDELGIDVDNLWHFFDKYLDIAQIDLKLDPITRGSCNVPVKFVPAFIKKYYPVRAFLWTGYVKPKGTHDRLKGAIVESENTNSSYALNNTATINLALKFPLTKKLYVLQQSVSTSVPLDKSHKPAAGARQLPIKKSLFLKTEIIGHRRHEKFIYTPGPIYIPHEVSLQAFKKEPCPRKYGNFREKRHSDYHRQRHLLSQALEIESSALHDDGIEKLKKERQHSIQETFSKIMRDQMEKDLSFLTNPGHKQDLSKGSQKQDIGDLIRELRGGNSYQRENTKKPCPLKDRNQSTTKSGLEMAQRPSSQLVVFDGNRKPIIQQVVAVELKSQKGQLAGLQDFVKMVHDKIAEQNILMRNSTQYRTSLVGGSRNQYSSQELKQIDRLKNELDEARKRRYNLYWRSTHSNPVFKQSYIHSQLDQVRGRIRELKKQLRRLRKQSLGEHGLQSQIIEVNHGKQGESTEGGLKWLKLDKQMTSTMNSIISFTDSKLKSIFGDLFGRDQRDSLKPVRLHRHHKVSYDDGEYTDKPAKFTVINLDRYNPLREGKLRFLDKPNRKLMQEAQQQQAKKNETTQEKFEKIFKEVARKGYGKSQVIQDGKVIVEQQFQGGSRRDQPYDNNSNLGVIDKVVDVVDSSVSNILSILNGVGKQGEDNFILTDKSHSKWVQNKEKLQHKLEKSVSDLNHQHPRKHHDDFFDDHHNHGYNQGYYHQHNHHDSGNKVGDLAGKLSQPSTRDEHRHPEFLSVAEYKGFVYGKEIGFGFTAGGGAIVKTPDGGILSQTTGILKFGFCYDA